MVIKKAGAVIGYDLQLPIVFLNFFLNNLG
jgi:hypothetical protein